MAELRATLQELRAATLARQHAQAELTSLYRERAIAEATASGQPPRAMAVSRSTWHHVQKKACGQSSTEQTWRERGGAGFDSKAFLIQRDWSLSMRPRSLSIWSVSGDVARVASD